MKKELTAERLRELLTYCPSTGVFTRRIRMGPRSAGSRAGCIRDDGYVTMHVDGKSHLAHRLAVLYVTGAWPEFHVDHINGVRCDNRLSNLRDVPRNVNAQNIRRSHSGSVSGKIGVSRAPAACKRPWRAEIYADGRSVHLGTFDTPDEAHAAYLAAKRRLHEGCTI